MSRRHITDEKLFDQAEAEEDYTTWTYLYAYDVGAGANLWGIINNNEGYATSRDGATGNLITADVYGNLHSSVAHGWSWLFDREISVTGKYWFEPWAGAVRTLAVFRNGVLIWQRLITLDNPDLSSIVNYFISPNGRYLSFVSTSFATANRRYIVTYVGS